MGGRKEALFQKVIRSHEGGDTKLFKNPITCNNYRANTTKMPRPTKNYNLLSNVLSPLASRLYQLKSHIPRRVGHAPERAKANMDCEGEVRHVP